jgi:3-hydroxyacyl-[acyl-carrier-protein] dehydratase
MNSANDLQHGLELLPHGAEFRFIDRLTKLVGGGCGEGEYKIRGDAPFLRGHFPGEPIFPGVLLVEAAAQLAGVVAQSDPKIPPLKGLKLAALRNVKILGAAKPGDMLVLEAEVTGRMGNLVQAQAIARVGNKMVLTAELTLSGTVAAEGTRV